MSGEEPTVQELAQETLDVLVGGYDDDVVFERAKSALDKGDSGFAAYEIPEITGKNRDVELRKALGAYAKAVLGSDDLDDSVYEAIGTQYLTSLPDARQQDAINALERQDTVGFNAIIREGLLAQVTSSARQEGASNLLAQDYDVIKETADLLSEKLSAGGINVAPEDLMLNPGRSIPQAAGTLYSAGRQYRR